MKCIDCKHGVPTKGKVTVSFNRNDSTVVIKGVPAMVCPVCGAYYLDENITEKVFKLGTAAVNNGA